MHMVLALTVYFILIFIFLCIADQGILMFLLSLLQIRATVTDRVENGTIDMGNEIFRNS